ncbi:MAG: 2Fe-2S iron-sulfur cluster binding domain-containing protein [Acidobacteriaceae bacterium]|nr:2Fe-2S iron-sulfur cluster binding domain-containing protein [Acidobacteriaceae bacterium]MBV9764424.1 2Fe-2S iron-sulfur cluster binding domain-containing protein [Acidobacteriaceae bacterium]
MNGDAFLVVLETPEGERSFLCNRNEFIWNAAARNAILLPSICHQGRCLTCAGRLLGGTVDQSSANSFFSEDKKAGFVLLCTAKPLSEVHIRTHEQYIMREYRAKLGLPAPYS